MSSRTSACRELPPPLRFSAAIREYPQSLASPPAIHGLASPGVQPLASPPPRPVSPVFQASSHPPPPQQQQHPQPQPQQQLEPAPPAPVGAQPTPQATRRIAVPRRLLSSPAASPTLKVGKYTVHAATSSSPSYATHPGIDGRLVVVVVPRQQLDAPMLELLRNERKISAAIGRSDLFCQLVDVVEERDAVFLFYPPVEWSHNLLKTLGSSAMPEERARRLFRQLAAAVKHCHDHNVVLRDLKVPSVLLDAAEERVWLSDFRFAELADQSRKIADRRGSPAYVSPEMMGNAPYCGRAADVWSLGVILFKMVCGSYPFVHHELRELFKQIRLAAPVVPDTLSPECRDLLERMLNKDPNARITLSGVLRHPWVSAPASDEQAVPCLDGELDDPMDAS